MISSEQYARWLDELALAARFGERDRRGTANYIDDAARRRAVDAMKTGTCVSLARPLEMREGHALGEGYLSVEVSMSHRVADANGVPYVGGPINAGFDTLHVAAHGQRQTHLDALNHCGLRGEWYSRFPVDDADAPSIEDLAEHRLFTRGVVADIPALRGTSWVDAAAPVTGDEIEAAISTAGVAFEPGDALLLYMGRDRYEAAGHRMDLMRGSPTPGAGAHAARWLTDHGVSILCWDFLDAHHPTEPPRQVHSLIWAIGQVLVDNCDLGPAVELAHRNGTALGGLIVGVPPVPKATGFLVNPMFIQ